MIIVDTALKKRLAAGNPVKVGMVGAGYMGRGIALQILSAMPGLRLIRPADANETAAAWRIAIDSDGPTALVLTRQNLPVLDGTDGAPVERGAYVLVEPDGDDETDLVLIGTGSEVAVCVEAATQLADAGVRTRVVSMPSWDLFAAQPDAYQESILPPEVPTLAVEAGASRRATTSTTWPSGHANSSTTCGRT